MIYLVAALCGIIAGLCAGAIHLAFSLIATERAVTADERSQWARERADLLQRIQAPEQAVVQHALAAPIPPSPATIPVDDDEAFWELVRALPRRQAQSVALHYLFDLSVADVAATLGIAEGSVKVHLSRARQTLAARLSGQEEWS